MVDGLTPALFSSKKLGLLQPTLPLTGGGRHGGDGFAGRLTDRGRRSRTIIHHNSRAQGSEMAAHSRIRAIQGLCPPKAAIRARRSNIHCHAFASARASRLGSSTRRNSRCASTDSRFLRTSPVGAADMDGDEVSCSRRSAAAWSRSAISLGDRGFPGAASDLACGMPDALASVVRIQSRWTWRRPAEVATSSSGPTCPGLQASAFLCAEHACRRIWKALQMETIFHRCGPVQRR